MADRRTLIAGNWKMNGLTTDGVALAQKLSRMAGSTKEFNCDILICPPATLISNIKHIIIDTDIMIGGQDCHAEQKGAHTGDISAVMLKDIKCEYVIVGHSERRADHNENNEMVKHKAAAAHEAGLKAIICIGETEEENENGKTLEVLKKQITESTPDSATHENTVIAYEPVWAIGTGKTPTIGDIADTHKAIREYVEKTIGNSAAVQLLYGGSVNPDNARSILSLEDVDGALVGGASLKIEQFTSIIDQSHKDY
ncbi:MAG: triose-phosphate isomerase [Alphaproteobacteria bacterium]|nr:triose-phosphate isomerase [Alphaproteobacteria bacterium]